MLSEEEEEEVCRVEVGRGKQLLYLGVSAGRAFLCIDSNVHVQLFLLLPEDTIYVTKPGRSRYYIANMNTAAEDEGNEAAPPPHVALPAASQKLMTSN